MQAKDEFKPGAAAVGYLVTAFQISVEQIPPDAPDHELIKLALGRGLIEALWAVQERGDAPVMLAGVLLSMLQPAAAAAVDARAVRTLQKAWKPRPPPSCSTWSSSSRHSRTRIVTPVLNVPELDPVVHTTTGPRLRPGRLPSHRARAESRPPVSGACERRNQQMNQGIGPRVKADGKAAAFEAAIAPLHPIQSGDPRDPGICTMLAYAHPADILWSAIADRLVARGWTQRDVRIWLQSKEARWAVERELGHSITALGQAFADTFEVL